MRSATFLSTLLIAAITTAALAQSDVDPTNKWSWGENMGWMNWRDANGAQDGVQGTTTHLSGSIWAENVGWINVGAGAGPYANSNHTDYGVNVLPNGDLDGLAWGENIGWINFGTAASLAGFNQHARYDAGAQRLRGYAWAENVGWINLDDDTRFVGVTLGGPCPGDANGDGVVDFSDLGIVLGDFGLSGPALPGDLTGDGMVNFDDLGLVLGNFGTTCQ